MTMVMVRGAVLSWPKPTPPVRVSVIVGAHVGAAFRRAGVGNGGKRRGVLADNGRWCGRGHYLLPQ